MSAMKSEHLEILRLSLHFLCGLTSIESYHGFVGLIVLQQKTLMMLL
jgi:hypothetical protein